MDVVKTFCSFLTEYFPQGGMPFLTAPAEGEGATQKRKRSSTDKGKSVKRKRGSTEKDKSVKRKRGSTEKDKRAKANTRAQTQRAAAVASKLHPTATIECTTTTHSVPESVPKNTPAEPTQYPVAPPNHHGFIFFGKGRPATKMALLHS